MKLSCASRLLALLLCVAPGALCAGSLGFGLRMVRSDFAAGEPVRVIVSVRSCYVLPPFLQVRDTEAGRIVRLDITDVCVAPSSPSFLPEKEYGLSPLPPGPYVVRLEVCQLMPTPLETECRIEGSATFTVGGGAPPRPVPTLTQRSIAALVSLFVLASFLGRAALTQAAPCVMKKTRRVNAALCPLATCPAPARVPSAERRGSPPRS